jgi:hypothetical protein
MPLNEESQGIYSLYYVSAPISCCYILQRLKSKGYIYSGIILTLSTFEFKEGLDEQGTQDSFISFQLGKKHFCLMNGKDLLLGSQDRDRFS